MFAREMMRRLRRGLGREDGSATAETVIWIPVYALVIALVGDTSLVFLRQAEAIRVVQDANREFAVGLLRSEAETEAYVQAGLSDISPNAVVDTQLINGIITTRVQMPASDLTATGLFVSLEGISIDFQAEFLSEV